MRSRKRRALLGLLSSGAVTALAGCMNDDGAGTTEAPHTGTGMATTGEPTAAAPTTDEPTDDPTESAAGGAEPTATIDAFDYRSWLPAPAAFEAEPYWTYYVDANAVASADIPQVGSDRIKQLFYPLPPELLPFDEAAESVALTGQTCVAALDVDVATVTERLEGFVEDGDLDRLESTEAPEGYVAYGSGPTRVWLGRDHLLYGSDAAQLTAIVEARAGEGPRYGADSDFGAVLDAVGEGDVIAGRGAPQQFVQDSTAFAYHWEFGSTAAALTSAFAFPDADSVNDEQLQALTEQDGFAEYGEFEQSTSGAVSVLEASIALEEFDLLQREGDGGGTDDPPQIAFEFEFEQGGDGEWDGDDDEAISITHTGGDTVDVARITVQYDDTDVAETANVTSTPPEDSTWAAGGEWVLRAGAADFSFQSGAAVSVVWTSSDGSGSAVLARATLP
jgi:hypothetical protein